MKLASVLDRDERKVQPSRLTPGLLLYRPLCLPVRQMALSKKGKPKQPCSKGKKGKTVSAAQIGPELASALTKFDSPEVFVSLSRSKVVVEMLFECVIHSWMKPVPYLAFKPLMSSIHVTLSSAECDLRRLASCTGVLCARGARGAGVGVRGLSVCLSN